jgi:4-amino-4-deoxy-L-arabinose transferase-like glycosyltransferase
VVAIAALSYVVVVLAFAAGAVAALRNEPAEKWTVGAGVVAAGFALTLLPGDPPLPVPVLAAALLCAARDCSHLSPGWWSTGIILLLVQTTAVVIVVSALRRGRSA